MRKQYDFSKAKKNPYARRLKKQITLRIDEPTILYFRSLSDATGIRYQTLINLYLRDCRRICGLCDGTREVPGHDGIRARESQSMLIGLEGHPCSRLLPRRSDLFCRHTYALQFLVGNPPGTWDASVTRL
jgi:hypothetical protein